MSVARYHILKSLQACAICVFGRVVCVFGKVDEEGWHRNIPVSDDA
jgi:hypothetical protein